MKFFDIAGWARSIWTRYGVNEHSSIITAAQRLVLSYYRQSTYVKLEYKAPHANKSTPARLHYKRRNAGRALFRV